MWRFKPFMPKEQTGLEGRSIDVGNLKIHVRNAFAEGGFSCVYLARDAIHPTKQYALKHIICNGEESLELVMKEISVMKLLNGHPNIVNLCGHTILDMGRTKEAFLVIEYCEKSLVTVLESRGSGYFEEKQILAIFRDICNAVFALHCLSPPIAHRDLKAENILLGSDGLWKLCDFGSTSTNHKRFEKPEEMGIEEDNIRKHTTPAYRAPEMWDLFRRELINEKVDIWALGCLLFRISYFKSAFDGESKLQILNGNYRIPELPKYSPVITDLIRDMLQSSPDARPDITQVWFRINESLPAGSQKSLPEGISRLSNKTFPMPHGNSPPPPSLRVPTHNLAHPVSSKATGDGGPLGAFWATPHAKNSVVPELKSGLKFDEEPTALGTFRHEQTCPESNPNSVSSKEMNVQSDPARKNMHGTSSNRFDDGPGFQIEAFQTFVAEFDSKKLSSGLGSDELSNGEMLEVELERLREQLHQANLEKTNIASKYEKLSAICRSQRQEIQELKQALSSPNQDSSRNQTLPGSGTSAAKARTEKTGAIWEVQRGISDKNFPSPDSKPWQPFVEDERPFKSSGSDRNKSSTHIKQATECNSGYDAWGFGTESFAAVPASDCSMLGSLGGGSSSQHFSEPRNVESQPAGWAGF